MNISLSLTVARWTVGTFNIHLDVDDAAEPALVAVPQKLVAGLADTISDHFAARYVRRHLT